MNAMALEELALVRGERFLEIGFGGGALLRMAEAAGAEVCGVDVSEARTGASTKRRASTACTSGPIRSGRWPR
jgi:cyclopropane fatty-acyl-phospholipid synthase-like methyltransferase